MIKKKGFLAWLMIILCAVFLFVMLIIPLLVVIINSLKDGLPTYINAVTNKYAVSSLLLTLLATFIAVIVNTVFGIFAAWAITKFDFKGKSFLATLIDIPFSISPVIAGLSYIMMFGRIGWAKPILDFINQTFGTDIKIVFAVPGVILATIFVTFPFVSREIIPTMNTQGRSEEEAAAILGAGGFGTFTKVTLPHIKWALVYGIILCTSRAIGEFGAVSALSKIRGKTYTLPLEVTYLYEGADTMTQAFAVSSLLVIIALIVLVLRNIAEFKKSKSDAENH